MAVSKGHSIKVSRITNNERGEEGEEAIEIVSIKTGNRFIYQKQNIYLRSFILNSCAGKYVLEIFPKMHRIARMLAIRLNKN